MRRRTQWLVVVCASVFTFVLFAAARPRTRREKVPPIMADRVVVEKRAHTLTLFRGGGALRTYRVSLGRGGLEDKLRAGDNRVPEGSYRIVGRNRNSPFHLALRVGYPNPAQIRSARFRGIDPGGDIMIHGIQRGQGWLGPLHRSVDWTKGCIAVTDGEIEEIWRSVPDGTPIEILP